MKYSIVIPTYNNCDKYLKPCIDSIFKWTDMADVELIISANGCTDNSYWYLNGLKNQFDAIGFGKNLKVVWNDAPMGYAAATNAGIKESTCDKIVLLNNDTVLLDQTKNQWLEMMDSMFSDENVGISAPVVQRSDAANSDFAVFFCAMIHRKVFEKIGFLNEEYGVGSGEDVEFCVEAKLAGFLVKQVAPKVYNGEIFTGSFPIYHEGEGTVHNEELVKNWNEIFVRNELKLAKKYNSSWGEKAMQKNAIEFAKEDLAWICDGGTEAKELYDEVVAGNIYHLTPEDIKGKAAIDIGANIGTFSLFAATLGASKVVCVEPVSTTYSKLVENIQRAKLEDVIHAEQAVVLDVAGKSVDIGINDKSGHNSLYVQSESSEEVSSVTLHDLLEMVEGDDVFLKIDCEGSEYDILINASQEDMKRVSTIAMEMHTEMNPKYQGIEIMENKLKGFDFKLKDRQQIYAWDFDANGSLINMRPIPMIHEIWVRS
jgi:FkbM family methyltransferase